MSEITFLGGAQTVTGSRHLLRTNAGHRVLVDCGMFQGLKALRERNWQELGIAPSSLDAETFEVAATRGFHNRERWRREGSFGPSCAPSNTD